MTYEEACEETVKLFGKDSFTEFELSQTDGRMRYYVGSIPMLPGAYQGFMGFSWEEALDYAHGILPVDLDRVE